MTRCKFLKHEKSKSCTSCTGWFCIIKGSKVKVGDTSICNTYELRTLCPRYIRMYPEKEVLPAAEPIIEKKGIQPMSLGSPRVAKPKPTRPATIVAPIVITPVDPLCPYLGAPPPGVRTCCGMYCYADNRPLRTGTQCKSRPTWRECVRRLKALKRGVPHAGS